jgi:hypothetical protein
LIFGYYGIFLWVGTEDEDVQLAIIKRLEKWHSCRRPVLGQTQTGNRFYSA